jgi:hypothetical protein
MDSGMSQFLSQTLYLIPLLLVAVFGIVTFFALPVPKQVRAFGVAGLALLLINSIGGMLFYVWYAQAMADGGGSAMASAMGLVRMLTSVLHAVGLALLVAAAFAGRGLKPP